VPLNVQTFLIKKHSTEINDEVSNNMWVKNISNSSEFDYSIPRTSFINFSHIDGENEDRLEIKIVAQ
jgi:hypothetical protein